ncbi:MAG: hypothetical protein KDE48_07675 [Anaerolineales bacterium]|nr:hypothetical protein [Anaerolineales bacterium]
MNRKPLNGSWGKIRPLFPTTIAFILGAISWYIISYWLRLLGRPPLVRSVMEGRIETHLSQAEKAMQIASADLRAGIERRALPDGRMKQVLCAGMRNFREPWARDFGFASFGLLELNEVRATRESLEVFLINQSADGQFPVKVTSTRAFNRYLHSLFGRQQPIDRPIRPKMMTAHNTVSLDGNALLVVAALNYLRHFSDDSFFTTHWPSLKNAVAWLEKQALHEDGLLHQGAYTDWADSISRLGCVLYANVLYWKALHELAQTAEKYGYTEEHKQFEVQAEQLKAAINAHFWRDELGYYITSEQFELLNSDGNLLAVAWGLASEAQSHAILDKMRDLSMPDPVPTQVTDRPYGSQYVAIENRLGGIPHYHTTAAWLWLGGWHIVALTRVGRLAEARTLLHRIYDLIVRDGVVHEVYGEDGRPLQTFWYTSEAPLTWSAGMVVYAHACYQRALAAEGR